MVKILVQAGNFALQLHDLGVVVGQAGMQIAYLQLLRLQRFTLGEQALDGVFPVLEIAVALGNPFFALVQSRVQIVNFLGQPCFARRCLSQRFVEIIPRQIKLAGDPVERVRDAAVVAIGGGFKRLMRLADPAHQALVLGQGVVV